MTYPPLRQNCHGFSIIEVMIACFILAIVCMSITQMLMGGENIRTHSRTRTAAEILISNDAERIRAAALRRQSVGDSTYEETMGKQVYTIKRSRNNPLPPFTRSDSLTQDITISVSRKSEEKQLVTLRLLQGFE